MRHPPDSGAKQNFAGIFLSYGSGVRNNRGRGSLGLSTAIRSVFTAGVAVAGAAVIALSALAPAPEAGLPTVHIPAIELTAAPALGAIPYQFLVNRLGDGLALAPILIGSVEQCEVCVGPIVPPSPTASPFTGWGAIGVGVGLLTSPFAIVGALGAGQSLTQALGVGLLAIQIPIDNTFTLVAAPRLPVGGYEFGATRARAAQAIRDTVAGTLAVTEQVLTGVRTVIRGTLVGVTDFAQTLATTGDVITAINAGLYPITTSIQTAVAKTVAAITVAREAVYADLTSGPGRTTFPIPTVSSPAGAAKAAAAASAGAVRSGAIPRATASATRAAAAPVRAAEVARNWKDAGSHQTRPARTRSAGQAD